MASVHPAIRAGRLRAMIAKSRVHPAILPGGLGTVINLRRRRVCHDPHDIACDGVMVQPETLCGDTPSHRRQASKGSACRSCRWRPTGNSSCLNTAVYQFGT